MAEMAAPRFRVLRDDTAAAHIMSMRQNRVPAGQTGGGRWAARIQDDAQARLTGEKEFTRVTLDDGTNLPIPAQILDRFRGVTAEGYLVVAADFEVAPGVEYLYALTPCCNASAKGLEYGVGCRRCYQPVDPSLGGPVDAEDLAAAVAR